MTKLQTAMAVVTAIMLIVVTMAFASHPGGDVTLKDVNGNVIADGSTPYSPKATCGACHDYGSGSKTVNKVHGYADVNGKINFMTYSVSSYAHGVSVGKHSDMGRNEEMTSAQNKIWGPATISSPGMWGRY